ncbi:MAG: hypothetical protein H5T64_09190 [Chloroflexi bacterium]|nr:hypothetical protein [Chloroflexota bacterium]
MGSQKTSAERLLNLLVIASLVITTAGFVPLRVAAGTQVNQPAADQTISAVASASARATSLSPSMLPKSQGDLAVFPSTPAPTPAPTSEPMLTPPPADEAYITPEGGGVLQSANGRIRLEFPPGAVREPATVRYVEVLAQPFTLSTDTLLRFNLEVVGGAQPTDARGHALFDQPLTLTINLEGLVAAQPLLAQNKRLEFAYVSERYGERATLVAVPLTSVDWERGQVVVVFDHFSEWELMAADQLPPTDWMFPTNLGAAVDPFTGSAAYNYSIEVVPGIQGLQPQLTLSYSSRTVDNLLTNIQAPWVGLGWSLETVEVVRKITTHRGSQGMVYGYENTFTLIFQGRSQRLVREPGSPPAGKPAVYHAESEDFLRIERYNAQHGGQSPSNTCGEYWVITARDGTVYRLGYNADSEQVASMQDYNPNNPPAAGYAGSATNRVAYRWRLDRVTDTHANYMTISYSEEQKQDPVVTGNPTYDHASYLNEILYTGHNPGFSPPHKVQFEREGRTFDTNTPVSWLGYEGSPNSKPYALFESQRLKRIKIYKDTTLVRKYELGYTYIEHGNRKNTLLQTITQYGLSGLSLPTVTLTYQGYENRNPGGEGDWFVYDRLITVTNGYGGSVGFSYAYFGHCEFGCGRYYRVSEMRTLNGQGNTAKVQYTYQTPTWNNFAPDDYDTFWGHDVATETVLAYNLTTLSQTIYDFNVATIERRGRPESVKVKDSSGAVRQTTTYTYYQEYTVSPQSDQYWRFAAFVAPSEVVVYPNDGSSVYKKTKHYYEASSQGGKQYGNLTQLEEYSGTVAVRKTWWRFYPDADYWIINKPGFTNVYTWTGSTWLWESSTQYCYDDSWYYANPIGSTNYGGNGSHKGELTLVRRNTGETYSQGGRTYYKMVDTVYDYDVYGNQINIIEYNSYGSLSDGTPPLGAVASQNPRPITITYESTYHTYPSQVTNAKGHTATYIHNAGFGTLTHVTDPNNDEVDYEYDEFGRLKKVWRPGDDKDLGHAATSEYTYTDSYPFRVYVKQRDDLGGGGTATYYETWSFYNGLGQLIQTQKEAVGGIIVADTAYDSRGLTEKIGLPRASTGGGSYKTPNWTGATTNQYDCLGRLTLVTYPDGRTVSRSYTNWTTAVIDENSHKKEFENDALGRLIRVREYTGTNPYTLYATTIYAYNSLDQLIHLWDNASNHTGITYNKLGQKTAMGDPDMGNWAYAYDPIGTLASQSDAKGQTIAFFYDELNRLLRKEYPAGTVLASFTYDDTTGGNKGRGRRTGMSYSGGGSASYIYDGRGRLTKETDVIPGPGGGTFVTQWTYNDMDRVRTTVYPGGNGGQTGETVTFTYGADSWLKSAVGTNTYVGDTTYNALGQVELRKLGSAATPVLTTDYIYRTDNFRLQWIKTGQSSPFEGLQKLEYTYDAAGNVLTIKDYNAGGTQTQSFVYDALDRVTTATASGGTGGLYSEGYTYNPIGNLLSKGGVNYTYGSSKPHAVTAAGSNSYAYDANGNTITRTVGSDTYALTYDAENRLTQVKKNGGAIAAFVYDGDGVRVKAMVNGTTTAYIGDYYEQTGSTIRKYYYANGQRVAMQENSTLYWLLTDHLGSTAITANSSGSKYGELRYRAYGETRYTWGTTPTTYRFTGQREESTIGLYFYNARWYDPALGRFVQADTLVPEPGNPQALNRYSYVLNNPLRYTDPTGLFSEEEIMKHLEVDTWEEVLAFFRAGGLLAGRWGWLAVLRQAQLGDEVQFLEGYAGFWPAPGPGGRVASRGIFVESNGSLYIRGAEGGLIAANEAAKVGNAYLLARPSSDYRLPMVFGPYYAERMYPHHYQLDPGRVDWVGAGLDAGGIAADALTYGAGGRLVNVAEIAVAGRQIGDALDVVSLVRSGYPFARGTLRGGLSYAQVRDFSLDTAALWIPFVPDFVSLVANFREASYPVP